MVKNEPVAKAMTQRQMTTMAARRPPRWGVPLTNGPRGYHCAADPTSEGGHATAGHCIKGTIAFPRSGFAWFA